MNVFSFVKDDWEKIPQNVRYYVLAGGLILTLTYASDHWGSVKYNLFGWNFRSFFFSMGVSLILLALLMIISKQVSSYARLKWLRHKYSIKNHPKDFVLVWFKPGRLYLFDKKSKLAYHVNPWETAEDLSFVGHGYNCPQDYETAIAGDAKVGKPFNVRFKSYQYVGSLNTRR